MSVSRTGVRLRVVAAAIFGVLLLLAGSGRALAQEGAEGSALGGVGVTEGWDWLALSLKLALVLAAIWLVILGMRWYLRRTGNAVGGGRSQSRMELLETRGLGGQRSLQLVRLGDRAVLLGVTQERITPLLEVDDPEELARLTAVDEPQPGERSFGSFLSGISGSLSQLRSRGSWRRGSAEAVSMPLDGLAQRQAAANAYRGMRVAELQRALEDDAIGSSGEGSAR